MLKTEAHEADAYTTQTNVGSLSRITKHPHMPGLRNTEKHYVQMEGDTKCLPRMGRTCRQRKKRRNVHKSRRRTPKFNTTTRLIRALNTFVGNKKSFVQDAFFIPHSFVPRRHHGDGTPLGAYAQGDPSFCRPEYVPSFR